MFDEWLIFVALVVSFGGAFLVGPLEKRKMARHAARLMAVCAAASLYCILAGLHLATNWEDAFPNATSAELGHVAGEGGGRAGVLLLIIRYWPWALMAFGVYFGYYQTRRARNSWFDPRRE